MNRRELLTAAAAAAALPQSALAQPAASPPLIGWLGLASENSDRRVIAAFRQGLADVGRIEGRTIRIAARHADGRLERVPDLIAELEALGVALFVAGGRVVARTLVRATKKPIVAARLPADEFSLYASLARPGGNLAAFSNYSEELEPKRIEILRDTFPGLSAIGILHAADEPHTVDLGGEAEKRAASFGLETTRLRLRTPTSAEVAALIGSLRPAGIRTVIVIQDYLTITLRHEIGRIALEQGVATITSDREFAEGGALISFGPDVPDLFRRSATYVDRILKGEKPGDLPIQLATRFEFVVNLKTARALGVTIPPSVILRADEVIE
jgi:putative ABC transport system substrate-binding protein